MRWYFKISTGNAIENYQKFKLLKEKKVFWGHPDIKVRGVTVDTLKKMHSLKVWDCSYGSFQR